ncbi:MAG: ankyrin repeat domain-containing protein [Endozoicomonadaceae bacterium]|nr:ankyrin repeat domain-containing protein [Endozoicomonadaceae bacterium]
MPNKLSVQRVFESTTISVKQTCNNEQQYIHVLRVVQIAKKELNIQSSNLLPILPQPQGQKEIDLNSLLATMKNVQTTKKAVCPPQTETPTDAVKKMHVIKVAPITKAAKTTVDKKEYDYNTALILASQNGDSDKVSKLLKSGYIDINTVSTALIMASKNGHSEIVSMILNYLRAHIDIVKASGLMAIIIDCCQKYFASDTVNPDVNKEFLKTMLKLLNVEDIDINTQTLEEGLTLLMIAIQNAFTETAVELLNNRNINVNMATYNDHITALMMACEQKNLSVLQHLIADTNLDINARDKEGCTALHYACKMGDIKVVSALLAHQQININAEDANGLTPLMQACKYGYEEIASLLIKYAANVNVQNKQGLTALMIASMNNDKNIADLLIKSEQIDSGQALIKACESGDKEVFFSLLKHKPDIDINTVNEENKTAFQFAATRKDIEITERLLDYAKHNKLIPEITFRDVKQIMFFAATQRKFAVANDLMKFCRINKAGYRSGVHPDYAAQDKILTKILKKRNFIFGLLAVLTIAIITSYFF